jgi:acyl-CoA reductase-like NAD-dependent aldehyde dehydrogenase
MRVMREEIFGPVAMVSSFSDEDEAVAFANDTSFGLAAGVWTRSLSSAHRLAAMLQAGSIYINQWGMADAAAPFGGYKASGVGREHGHAGLEAYLETKTVWASLA